jgi:exosortase/archaeosortase
MYAVGLSIGWFIIYDLWLTHLDELLTGLVIYSSAWALSLAGYNAGIEGYRITIDGFNTVLVYHACNGMVLMALFTGFILAFPGPIVKKLFYIPLGILIIH